MNSEALLVAMGQALAAADAWVGATAPNPPVGCVVLDRGGRTLAVAAHERAGAAHAEAKALAALRQAGELQDAHTLVLTLEPCAHQGRTPPCVDAILRSPIAEVLVGVIDPNPVVAGVGWGRLEREGRRVAFWTHAVAQAGALALACRQLIAPFATWIDTGRPWVTIKQAIDPTGSMIPPPGCKTFTSPSSLVVAHERRKWSDAIITGSGTVLADSPEFTVRRVRDHREKTRLLIVLDRRGRVPALYRTEAAARGFVVHTATDPHEALEIAGRAGALMALVEGGPGVTQAFLDQGLWDEHLVIQVRSNGGEDRIRSELALATQVRIAALGAQERPGWRPAAPLV